MFRKLRNRFIWMTMLATTIILVVSFSLVFFGVSASMRGRSHEEVPMEFRGELSDEMFHEMMHEERERQLESLARYLIMVGVGIEAVVLMVSYLYAERSIRPVKQAYEQQRDFIANASHELKTPIASIQANFEALGATEEPWTSNIDAELAHAQSLVTDLLTLARTDDVTMKRQKKRVDVAKLVKDKARVIEPRMGERELRLRVPERLEMEIYDEDFGQILNILLDNAAKYAKSWTEVRLEKAWLEVRNDGKTIPPTKLSRIFERFYQVDKTSGGTGLGLAIAKAVADRRRWSLTAESARGEIAFKLRLK